MAGLVGQAGGQRFERRSVLLGQRGDDVLQTRGVHRRAGEHAAQHARVGQVDRQIGQAGSVQAVQGQLGDLEVGFQPGMAEDLGAELQRLARRVQPGWPGVQHRAAVAEPGDTFAVEQMGVDARRLRRRVGAQAERAAAQLVDEFEGLEVEFTTGARQQRLEVLEQRRHHELEAVAAGAVQKAPPQLLDASGVGGQDVGDMLGQEPS